MKKYAVYNSSTGSYCYRYADTLEDLEGTGFEDIIEKKIKATEKVIKEKKDTIC